MLRVAGAGHETCPLFFIGTGDLFLEYPIRRVDKPGNSQDRLIFILIISWILVYIIYI
jgi:hypothetical protein